MPTVAMQALQRRALGAYLGLAVGDALGATVEFLTPNEIRSRHGVHDRITGGGWLRLKPGQVTDDTEMSLALGRAILERGAVEAVSVAQAFSDWMRASPVDIGHTVRSGVKQFRFTGEPRVAPSEYAAGNGACMRCLPVALATLGAAPAAVTAASRAQAHVTHSNPQSDAGTECVVEMVQGALLGLSREQLFVGAVQKLLADDAAFEFRGRRRENPSGYIVETLQAVLQALVEHADFAPCLVDVVNRGGDADTTGAIVGMIAGALYGYEAIPQQWLAALATETRAACQMQALALLQLSPAFAGAVSEEVQA